MWHQATKMATMNTAMIKIDPNVTKINKLSLIHLYEADYNLLLRILKARRLVWHIHKNNRINIGQAGSQPGCNAIDIDILKEMTCVYSRLTNTNLATIGNDAKSYYDRINCNISMIISRFYGMSSQACNTQGKAFQKCSFAYKPLSATV